MHYAVNIPNYATNLLLGDDTFTFGKYLSPFKIFISSYGNIVSSFVKILSHHVIL